MAPHSLRTRYPQGYKRGVWPFPKPSPPSNEAVLELIGQIRGLTLKFKALEEQLLALEDKHEALRGRFYASRPKGGGGQPESKAEILARLGFTPVKRG